MPETEETETVDTEAETETTDTEQEWGEDESTDEGQEDADSGLKKALAAERKARRDAEKERNTLRQQLADKDKPADELAIEQARREAEQGVLEKANARIVRSELKAAAAGKVKRPDLLIKITDLSAIEVDENGDPDADALNDAITTFLEEYPELSVEARSPGSADQGSQRRQAKPPQLTNDDIDRMTPEEIETARKEGRLNKLMGVS